VYKYLVIVYEYEFQNAHEIFYLHAENVIHNKYVFFVGNGIGPFATPFILEIPSIRLLQASESNLVSNASNFTRVFMCLSNDFILLVCFLSDDF